MSNPRRSKDNRSPQRIAADVRVGARVRAARVAAGLTQKQLAAALRISIGPIQHYEAGRNSVSASRLAEIAGLTGRSIAYFFGEAHAA